MRIPGVTGNEVLKANKYNINYNNMHDRQYLMPNSDVVTFVPLFKGNKYEILKYYGKAAFNIFQPTKELKEPEKRKVVVQTITAGAAVMAAATSGALAQSIVLENALLRRITSQMCFRISGCYAYNNISRKLIGEFLSIIGGQFAGANLAKEILKYYPGLGNAANAIITAVLHEITGNIWIKLLENWYKTKPSSPTIKINKDVLQKMQDYLLKEKSWVERIKEYDTPEIRNLIEKIQEQAKPYMNIYMAELSLLKLEAALEKMNKGEQQKRLVQIQAEFIESMNDALKNSINQLEMEKLLKNNSIKNKEKIGNEIRENLFTTEKERYSVPVKKVHQKKYFFGLKEKITNVIEDLCKGLSDIWTTNDSKTKIRM